MNSSSKAFAAAVAVVALGAVAGCNRVPSDGVLSDSQLESSLRETAKQINGRLPMMVDEVTRWESATHGPGRRWTYNYTLISMSSTDVTGQQIQDALGEKIRTSVCTTREMQVFVKNKVQVVYHYAGKDGADIGEIVVDTTQCT